MILRKNLKLAGITFIFFLITLAIFFPGFVSEDSISQLIEARSGIFTDGNPPIMAFIWRQIDHFYPGQTGMLILQLAPYWLGLFFIVIASDMGLKNGFLFLACIGMFPGTLGILGAIWKDLLLMSFGVFSMGAGMFAVKKKSLIWFTLSILSCFLACSFRQNGIFAVPPFIFGLLYSFFSVPIESEKRRAIISATFAIIGTVAFFALNSFMTYNVFHAKKSYLWRLLPLYDLAGIYYELGYIPANGTPPFATKNFSFEKIHSLYTSRSLMPLVLPLCPSDKAVCNPPPVFDISLNVDDPDVAKLDRLKSLWKNEIILHPIAYLSHRLNVFSQVLGLHDDLWGPIYFSMTENRLNLQWQLKPFQVFVRGALSELSALGFFYAWVFMILNVALLAELLRDRTKEMWGMIFGLTLSAFFFEGAYFLIAPSMDYRYSLWFIVGTLISGALLLHQKWITIQVKA